MSKEEAQKKYVELLKSVRLGCDLSWRWHRRACCRGVVIRIADPQVLEQVNDEESKKYLAELEGECVPRGCVEPGRSLTSQPLAKSRITPSCLVHPCSELNLPRPRTSGSRQATLTELSSGGVSPSFSWKLVQLHPSPLVCTHDPYV